MRTILPAPRAGVEVYDVDSGLGGQFTVSILSDLGGGMVEVRILHGNFTTSGWQSRSKPGNPRRLP